jgi:hypothetical protein
MRHRLVPLALFLASLASAQDPGARRDLVLVRESRTIPRDVTDDVTRIYNAPGTLRLTGAQTIGTSGDITSDVAILEGELTIAGRVTGHVVAINAGVIIESSARVERDLTILGGRLTTRPGGTIAGDIRTYGERVELEQGAAGVAAQEEPGDSWFRRQRRRTGGWGDLRLVSARTYNRVEGLPVLVGPAFGRDVPWGRISVDVLGVIRSADTFEWKSENLGHNVKGEVSIGKRGGLRLGGRLFDVVDAVEPWQLSDAEVGIASFFMHRDYRDYHNRHGQSVYGSLFVGKNTDFTVSYSDLEWGTLEARSPFTVFNGGQDWRPNPQLDDATLHLWNATWRYDTRNDADDPWSGWYIVADYEYGTGDIHVAGPTSPLVRPAGEGPVNYNRLFLDLRRYNRMSPDGQLNLRLVLGGWLNGDELPLQRRLSVGGPGSLPGYDFRRVLGETDYWQCSSSGGSTTPQPTPVPQGFPAQCERILLAQAEYRGEIRIDPFGLLGEERSRWRRGWGRDAEWVVFADAGRGWLVGRRRGQLQYPSNVVPHLGSFRSDVGAGLRFDALGLYVAKSMSDIKAPVNFLIRFRPRI